MFLFLGSLVLAIYVAFYEVYTPRKSERTLPHLQTREHLEAVGRDRPHYNSDENARPTPTERFRDRSPQSSLNSSCSKSSERQLYGEMIIAYDNWMMFRTATHYSVYTKLRHDLGLLELCCAD